MAPHESNHKNITVLTTTEQSVVEQRSNELKEMIEKEIEKVPFDSGFGFGSSAEDFSQEENFDIELSKSFQLQKNF